MNEVKEHIEFTVINADKLNPGLAASYLFDRLGGGIGSDHSADWLLTDNQKQIAPLHCQIGFRDGGFCLQDMAGLTFMNGASFPVGRQQWVQLHDNDEIKIGDYQLRVNFQQSLNDMDEFNHPEIDQLISSEKATSKQEDKQVSPERNAQYDPLLALDELENKWGAEPPACLINPTSNVDVPVEPILDWQQAPIASEQMVHADANNTVNAAFNTELHTYNEDLNVTQAHPDYDYTEDQHAPLSSEQHIAVGPVLRGLAVPLQTGLNSGQLQNLGEELGRAMRATIQGLLALHQNVDRQRYGVSEKNLQPIEDNPLRLGLNFEQTVDIMFGVNKSPVHLSAPSAIAESLKVVQYHQQAVQHAISYALNHILTSFSPDNLFNRFKHYRTAEQAQGQQDEAWAWNMYRAYFDELSSGRQQGFEKLFWEIFEQAYDQKLRELQQEQG
ncbi:type VI secretion system-associated FHA domain protein TagH [Motilimonas sp. KMU-193]|uniref:type VI secretion system-associated FHA domain protein TagH n=1 Tax=Motilimonas sp. KMU-193 TaxID=3388668 RepID=UPI00396B0445